jgi:DNA polymerase-1
MENRLIILDSNALLHRSFHALPPLTNKSGQQTGAVYGYLLTLLKAIRDTQADHIVACFDTKAKTFRHDKFQDYKAHRPQTPSEIISQIPIIKEILAVLRIPIFAMEGFEADDLIATICQMAPRQKKELEVFVVSGDLDNLQLVNDKIKIYTLGKGIKDTIIYDAKKVRERFGVDPLQMNDFKALTGDASDNVPGVSGIGKTTAADLIQRFGTIKNLYDEIATDTAVLKPKVKELLKNGKEEAFLSLELVETKKDVDMSGDFSAQGGPAFGWKIEDCKFGNFSKVAAKEILEKMEFNSLIDKILALSNK